MSGDKPVPHYIDLNSLPEKFPTHRHNAPFWESLGRAVATFGFLEEILGKAIFAFTATKLYKQAEIAEAYNNWLPTLEHALTDPLGKLIDTYEKEIRENPNATRKTAKLIEELREVSKMRNILCHGSWRSPDTSGASIPFFMNNKKEIVDRAMDRDFIDQVQKQTAELAYTVINTVTQMGLQFPGSAEPGKMVWETTAS